MNQLFRYLVKADSVRIHGIEVSEGEVIELGAGSIPTDEIILLVEIGSIVRIYDKPKSKPQSTTAAAFGDD